MYQLIALTSDLNEDQVSDPASQPRENLLRAIGLRNRFRRGQDARIDCKDWGRTSPSNSCCSARTLFHVSATGLHRYDLR